LWKFLDDKMLATVDDLGKQGYVIIDDDVKKN